MLGKPARSFIRGVLLTLLLVFVSCSENSENSKQSNSEGRAIDRYSDMGKEEPAITPDGEIIDGVRIIRLSTVSPPRKIYVYRGETVRLILEKMNFPYSIRMPEFGISEAVERGKDFEVKFKAQKTGVFPILCNGHCPDGDGSRFGQIVVMQYRASGDAEFTEIGVDEAVELIRESNPLILDVRTPDEYSSGHIKDAKLIPLHQLESRLSEIDNPKENPVLVYCRSGNRSTVASEILIRHGFKRLYNLRSGVIGWQRAGKELKE